jgi:hypothetical protein
LYSSAVFFPFSSEDFSISIFSFHSSSVSITLFCALLSYVNFSRNFAFISAACCFRCVVSFSTLC